MKNREDMTWIEEREYVLTLPGGVKRLKTAEGCNHFLYGMCGESLESGRTWSCMFLRDVPKGTVIVCDRYDEKA